MKIAEIAEKMRDYTRRHPYHGGDKTPYQTELPRGLTLTYTEDEADARLALSRVGVMPSRFEEQICRQAFGAPAAAGRVELAGEPHYLILSWSVRPSVLKIHWPAACPWLAVPNGHARQGDKTMVEYADFDEAYWAITASDVLRGVLAERAKPLKQTSMFTSNNYYQED